MHMGPEASDGAERLIAGGRQASGIAVPRPADPLRDRAALARFRPCAHWPQLLPPLGARRVALHRETGTDASPVPRHGIGTAVSGRTVIAPTTEQLGHARDAVRRCRLAGGKTCHKPSRLRRRCTAFTSVDVRDRPASAAAMEGVAAPVAVLIAERAFAARHHDLGRRHADRTRHRRAPGGGAGRCGARNRRMARPSRGHSPVAREQRRVRGPEHVGRRRRHSRGGHRAPAAGP
jgi:hypothetical protein